MTKKFWAFFDRMGDFMALLTGVPPGWGGEISAADQILLQEAHSKQQGGKNGK